MSAKLTAEHGLDLDTLDLLLDSFAQAAKSPTTSRAKFYESLNLKIAASTGSLASIVWVRNKAGQVRVVHQVGWNDQPNSVHTAVQKCVKRVFQETPKPSAEQHLLKVPAFFGHCKPSSGLEFAYALVRSRKDSQLEQQVFADLAVELASQIEVFENAYGIRKKAKKQHELTLLAQLMQNLGKAKGLREVAFHLVNDLVKILNADRVTFTNASGKVVAISGTAQVSYRTAVVRNLSRVAKLALSTSSAIDWSGDKISCDAKRKPRSLDRCVGELSAREGFVIPVIHRQRRCGALAIEYFDHQADSSLLERQELVNETVSFVAPVLAKSVELYSIPGINFLNTVFNHYLAKPIKTVLLLTTLASLIFVVGYALFCVPRDFYIHGEGKLLPAVKRHVFAQLEGEIEGLFVDDGANVIAKQQLLTIRSENLEQELISVEGQAAETLQELQNLKMASYVQDRDEAQDAKTRNASETERAKIRLKTLQDKLDFFNRRKSELSVTAPIAGQITTTDLRQRLTARPIERGDLLMTIADTAGEWEIELLIPDNRVEFVSQAIADEVAKPLLIDFRLASDSNQTYQGTLKFIDYRSEPSHDGNTSFVKCHIAIDEDKLGKSLRLDTRAYGKINCGKRSNFFLLTYEAQNKIREWLFQ